MTKLYCLQADGTIIYYNLIDTAIQGFNEAILKNEYVELMEVDPKTMKIIKSINTNFGHLFED